MPELLPSPYGKIVAVRGSARTHGDVAFVPVEVQLHGNGGSPSFPFAEWLGEKGLGSPSITDGLDAIWVRGRLTRLFGVASLEEDERPEKSLSSFELAAVLKGEAGIPIVPFVCSDHYGRTALTFSSGPHEPPAPFQETVARRFWELLLAVDPEDVADYEDRAEHPGAGVTMIYGIEGGRPFYREEP